MTDRQMPEGKTICLPTLKEGGGGGGGGGGAGDVKILRAKNYFLSLHKRK